MSGNPGNLGGKVALVTGASRGIGKGIALELGAAGATVFVTGRSEREGRLPGTVTATAEEVNVHGGTGIGVRCDHADDDAVRAVLERIRDQYGRLDVLVNNVYNSPAAARWLGKPFWDVPPSAWDETFGVGVRSHYVATHYAAPMLIESGGLIVNISSPGARRYMHNAVYGVAKAALDRFTADIASDLTDTTVTAVSLWPGIVNTELLQLVPASADGTRVVTLPGEGAFDLNAAETPHFTGRAVVALACDPDRRRHTGNAHRVVDVAREYGFTDVDGRIPDND